MAGAEVSLMFSLLGYFEVPLFSFSVLVAVVKDKEVFLTTARETTKRFSFQFSPRFLV